ncbi:uncharacterized protein B0I36DRAFT_351076 [Microdochium trichocladiopsis]|uniref:Uncharacterized protein n=1 Tax=Microdochium trichocladiopsis TaxID=1682393 RepID=A0A9P8Y4P1_9PEZI|nr:uncharacterized protein B0I36DRAFT_351076 [Microdochium trichocladiopsis]KAH7027560.1 hypothetical protein B0I36DRAFT_351076 [Microdochium trichocladiopsis]
MFSRHETSGLLMLEAHRRLAYPECFTIYLTAVKTCADIAMGFQVERKLYRNTIIAYTVHRGSNVVVEADLDFAPSPFLQVETASAPLAILPSFCYTGTEDSLYPYATARRRCNKPSGGHLRLVDSPDFVPRARLLKGNLQHEISLPLLINPPEDSLACHETAVETAYVSSHISSRLHALFSQLSLALGDQTTTDAAPPQRSTSLSSTSPATSVLPEEGMFLELKVASQSFDIFPFCDHRQYHSRRLTLSSPDTLPTVPSITKLLLKSTETYDGGDNNTSEDYRIRPLSLLIPFQLAAKLPDLHTLILPWMWERPLSFAHSSRVVREHYTRPWEGPLRDARHDFGNAILEQQMFLRGGRIPNGLKNVLMHFWTPQQVAEEDQSERRPNLIISPTAAATSVGLVEGENKDPVSLGLCKLAGQLERLDLRAMVTEDLFPTPAPAPAGAGLEVEQHQQHRQWSKMQRLRIEFHPLRPDGKWFFIGPKGEDPHGEEGGFEISEDRDYPREHDIPEDEEVDEEYEDFPTGDVEVDILQDMFRTEPHRERIEPLLARFAQAVREANMPSLQDAELFAYLWWAPSDSREEEEGYAGQEQPYAKYSAHRWGVKYITSRGGNGDGGGAEARTTAPTVQWQVGDWRPSPDVMALFEGLGTQEWLDFDSTHGRPLPLYEDAMKARLF